MLNQNTAQGLTPPGIEDLKVSIRVLPLGDLPRNLTSAHHYWQRILPDGAIGPKWADFDMMQLPTRFLPTAVVVDYDSDTHTYRYRYWGSALTPVFGMDLTGKTFEDCPGAFRSVSYQTYDAVRLQRAPTLIKFRATYKKHETDFQLAFRMPLSENGQDVTGIVSLLAVEYRRHDWESIIE